MPKIKLTKIVSTYELPEISPVNPQHESLKFTIQIRLSPEGRYIPRVLRRDTYDVLPHYQGGNTETAMEEILVVEHSRHWEKFECDSEEEAIQCVLKEFEAMGLLSFQ